MQIFKDVITLRDYQIVKNESAGSTSFIVEGILSIAGKLNGNNRIYDTAIWQTIVNNVELLRQMAEGEIMGEIEHPNDGLTNLNRTSHFMRKIWMEGNTVFFRAELLDNEDADRLKDILRKGGKPGISTRGRGTSEMRDGVEYVNSDYQFETADFVYNPSESAARPKIVSESNAQKQPPQNNESSKGEANMLTQIEKIENRVSDIRRLMKASPANRRRHISELRECQVQLGKIVAEDATLAIAAEDVTKLISTVKAESTSRKPKKKESKKSQKREMEADPSMDDLDDEESYEGDYSDESYEMDLDAEEMDDEHPDELGEPSPEEMGYEMEDPEDEMGSYEDPQEMGDMSYEQEDEPVADIDADDDDDDEDEESYESKNERYRVEFQCPNRKCQALSTVKAGAKLVESRKLARKCRKCKTAMRLEGITRLTSHKPQKCVTCESKMRFVAKTGCYKCASTSCGAEVPVLESMAKAQLIKRYRALAKVTDDLVERSQSLYKSNRTLSERFDASVKLVGDMLTERDRQLMEQKIEETIAVYPDVKKFTSILKECKSMQALESTIATVVSDMEQVNAETLSESFDKVDDLPFDLSEDLDAEIAALEESFADFSESAPTPGKKPKEEQSFQNAVLSSVLERKGWA